MFHRFSTLLFLLFLPLIGVSQRSREYQAERSLQKKKWEHAYSLLKKSIHKDSINIAALYVMAHYFFEQQNPSYQIDSAYRYTTLASQSFKQSSLRQKERLKKFPIDSMFLQNLQEAIEATAFERAKKANTERSYLDFLAGFPKAKQYEQVVQLRDEVSYLDAIRENTFIAFKNYFSTYPTSIRATEAKAHYEKLLYLTKTADHHLLSYELFVKTYPQSPYTDNAEQHIFEIRTAEGTAEQYRNFLEQYPRSTRAKKAQNILFNLVAHTSELKDYFLFTDSLLQVAEQEKHYLVPILHAGLIGFINDIGVEVIQPQGLELADEYRCGDILEDVLVLSNKIISRSVLLFMLVMLMLF